MNLPPHKLKNNMMVMWVMIVIFFSLESGEIVIAYCGTLFCWKMLNSKHGESFKGIWDKVFKNGRSKIF